MIRRDDLIKFVYQTIGEDLLKKSLEKDEIANGIQWLGAENISKVVLGVSVNEDFLLETARADSQMIICHHGLDVRTWKSRYPRFIQKQLKVIVENQLTVMAFHYALDAHPTIGNNATIIRLLGAKIKQPLFDDWGWTAEFDQPQTIEQIKTACEKLFNHKIFSVIAGPKNIKTIGVVSGRGVPSMGEIAELEAKGVELFISGETSEWTVHQMKESAINYFCGGHYATEVFGVQELGKTIKAYYKDQLELEFIDIPNEI